MDIILVRMEKNSEGFYKRISDLAMEYGVITQKETYTPNHISVGDLRMRYIENLILCICMS